MGFKEMKNIYLFNIKNVRYSRSKMVKYLNSLLFKNYYMIINKIKFFPSKLQLILYNKIKEFFNSILLKNLNLNMDQLILINIKSFKFINMKKRIALAKGQMALRTTNFYNYHLLFSEY